MIDENAIRARYAAIKHQLDERGRRVLHVAGSFAVRRTLLIGLEPYRESGAAVLAELAPPTVETMPPQIATAAE
jgi:hypothetical protein